MAARFLIRFMFLSEVVIKNLRLSEFYFCIGSRRPSCSGGRDELIG